MLTAEQIQGNRRTLANLLRAQMNLPAAPSDWSYSQRVEYNKAFAAYVLAHPSSFGASDLQTADIITQELPAALDDTSVSATLSAFGSAVLDNAVAAGDDVAGVGKGVLTAASLAAWVIPGGLLILAAVFIFSQSKKIAAAK